MSRMGENRRKHSAPAPTSLLRPNLTQPENGATPVRRSRYPHHECRPTEEGYRKRNNAEGREKPKCNEQFCTQVQKRGRSIANAERKG